MVKPRDIPRRAKERLAQASRRWRDNLEIRRKAELIAAHIPAQRDLHPVIFFKASTGLSDFTYNNAIHILAAWGLRLEGIPVIHFACLRGMPLCVMGTYVPKPTTRPPCATCITHARALFTGADVEWFDYHPDAALSASLVDLQLNQLMTFEYQPALQGFEAPLPLGALVTPGLRWILRRHSLQDDEPTRYLYRQYILSAWNVAREFAALLDRTNPQVVFLFNGQFFPEATAAWIARRRGIRVVTHEVGFQPFSGFFTEGEATAYPIHIPDDFDLDEAQSARLDAYLVKRFHGEFSMAGIRFWPDMKGLDEAFLQKAAGFKQIVPVFTNIIFDTSQPHANTIFTDMFAWLELVIELARLHPETLFVIRAHPDEARAGKESRESVAMWFEKNAVDLPNLAFIPAQERISSYDLVRMSKFVLIYNSTIGLESILLDVPVLAAGQTPFLAFDTVFFEPTRTAYLVRLNAWLEVSKLEVPQERQRNARRFLYYRTYRSSLPFGEFLESTQPMGFVRLKKFSPTYFVQSPTARALLGGLFDGKQFELDV